MTITDPNTDVTPARIADYVRMAHDLGHSEEEATAAVAKRLGIDPWDARLTKAVADQYDLAAKIAHWIERYDANERTYDTAVEEAAAEMPGGIVDDDTQADYEDAHESLAYEARNLLALAADRMNGDA